MAVFREQPHCPNCGEKIEGVYDTSKLNSNFCGDTFIKWDWEKHRCKSV